MDAACPEGIERCLEGFWRRPMPGSALPPDLVLESSPGEGSELRRTAPPGLITPLSSTPLAGWRECRPEQAVAAAAAEAAAVRAVATTSDAAPLADKVAVPGAAAAVEAAAEAAEAEAHAVAQAKIAIATQSCHSQDSKLEVVTLATNTNDEHFQKQFSEHEAADAATGQTLSPMSMTTRSATDSNLQLGAEACMAFKDVRWFSAELERQRCDYAARLQKMVTVLAEEGKMWEARVEKVTREMEELRRRHSTQLSELHAEIQRLSDENADLRQSNVRDLDVEVRRLGGENTRLRRLSCPESRRMSSEHASVQELSSILEPDSEVRPLMGSFGARPEFFAAADMSAEVRSLHPELSCLADLEREAPRLQSARLPGHGSVRDFHPEVIRRTSEVVLPLSVSATQVPRGSPGPRRQAISPGRTAAVRVLVSPERRLCRPVSPEQALRPRRRTLSPEQAVRQTVSPIRATSPVKPASPLRPVQVHPPPQPQPQPQQPAKAAQTLPQAASTKMISGVARPLLGASPRVIQRGGSLTRPAHAPLMFQSFSGAAAPPPPAAKATPGASVVASPQPVAALGPAVGLCHTAPLGARRRSLF